MYKFDVMKKGYNRYQVDDYIQEQSMLLEEKTKQLNAAQTKIETLTNDYDELLDKYNKLNDNLAIKEKYANEIARIAMKEANAIVDSANENADAIIKEALMMAREVLCEIARISKEAKELKSSMKDELQSLHEVLDKFEVPALPSVNLLNEDE